MELSDGGATRIPKTCTIASNAVLGCGERATPLDCVYFLNGAVGKVDQQFEHLSDAQIENYWNWNTGAEPDDVIESHLAICSECRSRVLRSSRSQLGLVSSQPAQPRGPDCPQEAALLDLAAGLTPPADASRLIQHAAHCDRCGSILRGYTEDFSEDLSPEAEALLQQLKNAAKRSPL